MEKNCHIFVPYSQGHKSYKTICSKYGIQLHFKGGQTLKNFLVFPKDKDMITKQRSVSYWFKCDKTESDDEYKGESPRTFGERCKEHWKAPSPIFEHQNSTGHVTTVDYFQILGWEGCSMARAMKKVYIYHTLNKNIGKYNLPHI